MLTLFLGDRVSIVDGFLIVFLQFVKRFMGGVMKLSFNPSAFKHGCPLRTPGQAKKFEQASEVSLLLWSRFMHGTHYNFEIATIL